MLFSVVLVQFFQHPEAAAAALTRRTIHFIHKRSNDQDSAAARFQEIRFGRWIGDSISNLAAAAELGGDLIRVRLAVLQRSRISAAATSVVVNITLSVFTQTVFTFIGLNLLVAATGRSNLWGPAIAGAPVAIAAVAGFTAVGPDVLAAQDSRVSADPPGRRHRTRR